MNIPVRWHVLVRKNIKGGGKSPTVSLVTACTFEICSGELSPIHQHHPGTGAVFMPRAARIPEDFLLSDASSSRSVRGSGVLNHLNYHCTLKAGHNADNLASSCTNTTLKNPVSSKVKRYRKSSKRRRSVGSQRLLHRAEMGTETAEKAEDIIICFSA